MTKSIKRIVVFGAVVVGIALLLVIVLLVFPKQEVEPVVTDDPNDKPTVYIINEDGNDLKRMHWYWNNGEELEVRYVRDEKGKLSYEATPEAYYFDWNTSKFRSMMFTMSTLTSMGEVEKDPQDLSKYGLDDPYFRMELEYSDKTLTLIFGNPTIDGYAYTMVSGDDTVHMVGSYLAGLISRSIVEYRQIDSFPVYSDEEIYEKINHVLIVRRDGTPIEIVADPTYEMEGNEAMCNYMMLQPVVSSAADETVRENVLDQVAQIAFSKVYGDIGMDRLADFGLDKPARVYLEDVDGNTCDIMVGATDSNVYYCAFTKQYDDFMDGVIDQLTVLEYQAAGFEPIDIDYMTLMNRVVWIQEIHTVQSIDYEYGGNVRHVQFTFEDYITDANTEAVHVYGALDGKDIGEQNTKRLYARTLNLREIGTIEDDVELGEAEITVTLNLVEGGKRELKLYRLNERQYCAVVDGAQRFYVYRTNVQNITDAIARLDDDRDLALLYDT
ncbi:MAG: DUF4340 domain-containing protein [Oscillospiraceae bacterium]|nr:DUF4340 domain-containing protein [Oscillospiraceae bacterium]